MKETINIRDEDVSEETPLTSVQTHSEEPPKEASDSWAIALLSCISMVHGIPMGFFIGTVSLTLAEKGASYGDLSEFSVILLPFALKIFLAPIADTYYWEKLGKRKTYIVPSLILNGILWIVNSFFINEYIADRRVGLLTMFGFICVILLSFMDIASDAWVITIVKKENYPIASAFQGIFGLLGFFIAFNMLVPLTSVEFLNKYIFAKPRKEAIITFQDFILGTGIFFLLVALMAFLFPEKKVHHKDSPTIKQVVVTLKQFYFNKNLRYLAIFLLTLYVPFEAVISLCAPTLVKKGLEKQTISNIVTIVLPVVMVLAYFAGKIVKHYEKKHFTLYFIAYVAVTLFLVFPVVVVTNFEHDINYNKTSLLLIFLGIYFAGFVALGMISYSAFIYKITPETMASTFITAINSLNNLGRLWPETLALALGDYIELKYMLVFALAWILFYQYFFRHYIIPLQEKDVKDFGFYINSPKELEYEEGPTKEE